MSRPSIWETTSRKSSNCKSKQKGITNKLNTKQRRCLQKHKHLCILQTQAFVLAVQNIDISTVAQYRELKRMETAFWGVPQITEHVNSWSAKDLEHKTQFEVFLSILHRHTFPADSTTKTEEKMGRGFVLDLDDWSLKQSGCSQIHGPQKNTPTSTEGAGRCHCWATLHHLWKVLEDRRGAQGLEESQCHSNLQKGQEGGPREPPTEERWRSNSF